MALRSVEGSSLSISGCTCEYWEKYAASDIVRPGRALGVCLGPGEVEGPGVLEGALSYWAQ